MARDTRETVDEDSTYLYFDLCIDEYQEGLCTLPMAIERFKALAGLAIAEATD